MESAEIEKRILDISRRHGIREKIRNLIDDLQSEKLKSKDKYKNRIIGYLDQDRLETQTRYVLNQILKG